jgi:putative intracellular protease/amidase
LDAIGPLEVLGLLPGAEVRLVWHEVGPIAADNGVLIMAATHTFEETPSPDIVLVPGSGAATATTATDQVLLDWLRAVDRTTTWTTSVCTGSVILASAGLLTGRPATSHWSAQSVIGKLGAIPQRDARVVNDGKYLTSAGVSAGIDLALWLVGEVAGRTTAEAIQLAIEYDPQPPFDSGHLSKATPEVRRRVATLYAREGAELLVADPRAVLRESVAMPRLLWTAAIERSRRRRRIRILQRRGAGGQPVSPAHGGGETTHDGGETARDGQPKSPAPQTLPQ